MTLALLASLLVALQPGEAQACSCVAVTTEEMVAASDLVFVGEEISRSAVNNAGWPSVAVTFRVLEAYKGEVAGQMTLLTGSGGGDCGVGPQSGLVGITTSSNGGLPAYDICGSVHEPAAIAALLEPIGLVDAPTPSPAEDQGINPLLWLALGALAVTAAVATVVHRRRHEDWQDGWSSRTGRSS